MRPTKKTLITLAIRWYSAGITSDISELEDSEINELEKILGKTDISDKLAEIHGVQIYDTLNSTEVFYTNQKYSVTNGNANGIDSLHVEKTLAGEKIHVVEVKFTKKYPSQNLGKAIKQLQSRFHKSEFKQLQAGLLHGKDRGAVTKGHPLFSQLGKTDIEYKTDDLVVPAAFIVTEKNINPKVTVGITKIICKLEK